MGGVVTGTTAPAISIWVNDPTNASGTANATIRLMQGIAGSGLTPVAIDSATGGVFNYTDVNLANNTQAYYYAEISIAGGYVITSPIWYTKTSVFPLTLLDFTAKANNEKQVLLQWRTTNEVNSNKFVVERSADGVAFETIGNVTSNNTAGMNYYQLLDQQPLNGINYYRLKQVDKDGKYSYSNIVAVNLNSSITKVALTPNPARDRIKLQVDAAKASAYTITIADAIGRSMHVMTKTLRQGNNTIDVSVDGLQAGTYFMIIRSGADSYVQRFVKE